MAETEMTKRERYRIVEALHKPRWSAEHVSMAATTESKTEQGGVGDQFLVLQRGLLSNFNELHYCN